MSGVIPVYQKLGHGNLSNPKSKVTKYPLYVAIDVHYGDFSWISVKIERLDAGKICAKRVKTRKKCVLDGVALPWNCLRQRLGVERAVLMCGAVIFRKFRVFLTRACRAAIAFSSKCIQSWKCGTQRIQMEVQLMNRIENAGQNVSKIIENDQKSCENDEKCHETIQNRSRHVGGCWSGVYHLIRPLRIDPT